MKNFKFYFLAMFVALGLFATSCHDHDEDNEITITIEEPTDNATIEDCKEVHVHVKIEATDENHEVEIVLHPEGNENEKIIDFDKHSHDKVVNFDQEVNLCSYPAGTCFHLEVTACADHDCEKKKTADVEFCLKK